MQPVHVYKNGLGTKFHSGLDRTGLDRVFAFGEEQNLFIIIAFLVANLK